MSEDCNDAKKPTVNSKDQLYHILNTETFTFCLICLEEVNSNADVVNHFYSGNHVENVKCLFKACNPSLIYVIDDERYKDIVTTAVFDISVLLGKETCYICRKDNSWFCIMCEMQVSDLNCTDDIMKDHITTHILSETHVRAVKEVCFLYRLNSEQDFLLLHKSIVYCSICRETFQCNEASLLETALDHLEVKKHQSLSISNDCQSKACYSIPKEEPNVHAKKITDERIENDCWNTGVTLKIEGENADGLLPECAHLVETKNIVCFQNSIDIEQPFGNEHFFGETTNCLCIVCKRLIRTLGESAVYAIDGHFNKYHNELYLQLSFRAFMNLVIFYNDSDNINNLKALDSMNQDFLQLIKKKTCLKKEIKLIAKRNNCYFCMMCLIEIPSHSALEALIKNLIDHFKSPIHIQKNKKNYDMKLAFRTSTKNKETMRDLKTKHKQIMREARLIKKQENRKRKNLEKHLSEAKILALTDSLSNEETKTKKELRSHNKTMIKKIKKEKREICNQINTNDYIDNEQKYQCVLLKNEPSVQIKQE